MKSNIKRIFSILLILFVSLFVFSCEFPTGTNQEGEDEIEEGIEYNIEYVLNGGTFNDEYPKTYISGKTTELTSPVKGGYRFTGWYDFETDLLVESISDTVSGDIKLYAKWESAIIYSNIIYNTNGGTLYETADGPYPTTYLEGTAQGLAPAYKDGYYFRGWYKDEALTERMISISRSQTGDVVLYAKWEEKTMENTYIGILGDSISTFYSPTSSFNSLYTGTNQYYYPIYCSTISSVTQTWWYKTCQGLSARLHVSNSYSGGTVIGSGESSGNNSLRLAKLTQNGIAPDLLIIWLGVNDAVAKYSVESFGEVYRSMIWKIQEMYPSIQIFICTLPYETYTDGIYREAYNTEIREISEELEVPLIDLTVAWDSTTEVKNNWTYLNDNIHPSAKGMDVISQICVKTIKNYYNLD